MHRYIHRKGPPAATALAARSEGDEKRDRHPGGRYRKANIHTSVYVNFYRSATALPGHPEWARKAKRRKDFAAPDPLRSRRCDRNRRASWMQTPAAIAPAFSRPACARLSGERRPQAG
ncbi:hypothetical protein SJ05684_c34750 [Sinorhizobium sojae CCBAU 05684]|uniref:Uncharacterized protein n=1 Tax=Sinorhizobium sojae CCBAU 05684 TaxID=716928 RepID=A0A249PG29_9HYPH|nr:hypothetical protein SJ05684_c34750 [Sinorhizobium sojae CCBAU 05684]